MPAFFFKKKRSVFVTQLSILCTISFFWANFKGASLLQLSSGPQQLLHSRSVSQQVLLEDKLWCVTAWHLNNGCLSHSLRDIFPIELQTSAAWKPELWSLSDVFAFQINRGINPWTGTTLLLLERSYLVKNSEQLHIVGAFMSLSCGNLTFCPPLFFLPDKHQQVSQNFKVMVSFWISVCWWYLIG